jgi:hypothetical protein
MKKVLFIFTFLLAFSYMNAQENKFATKRAAKAVAFILSEMDFTDAQAQFIEETLYSKYAKNGHKIKGKGLSNKEKKVIYRKAASATRKLLRQEFSKGEVLAIIKLERQSFKK